MLTVSFHGVRGSTPCPCADTRRYGGNTSCVAIESPGHDPLLLDLGTGVRAYAGTLDEDQPFRGHVLLSHLHFDHVQGLPFFTPFNRPGACMDVYGPTQEGGLEAAFEAFVRPPYFPVTMEAFAGEAVFHEVERDDLRVGRARVKALPVPHVGLTVGYRIESEGVVIAYVSDHQQPPDGGFHVADEVLELCDGADLVIHDAQYTIPEFRQKPHWGHCTVEYALHVAREAGAQRVALFHHDPTHTDDVLDGVGACSRAWGDHVGIEVLVAAEGLSVSFER